MNESCRSLLLDDLLPYLVPPTEDECPAAPLDEALWEEGGLSGPTVHRHVSFSLGLRLDGVEVHLTATADAVLAKEIPCVVQTCTLPRHADLTASLRERLLLRGRLLALSLAKKKELEQVDLRLLVYAEGRFEQETLSLELASLSRFLSLYAGTIASLLPLFYKEKPSVVFPHKQLRAGQKDLIHAVWDAIKQHSRLYACAPTGIGKTLAVLYPALRALETGRAEKVYYASPKNTLKMQAAAAVEALQQTRTLRTLVLSAKMSLCPQNLTECERGACPYAEAFHEKLPRALAELAPFSCITEKELREVAEHYGLCPFELAVHMQKHCQVIIADYNHVLDPVHGVARDKKNSILLIDEAHNLPSRIRALYTEALTPSDFDFYFRSDEVACAMLKEHFAPLIALFAKERLRREEKKEYFCAAPPDAFWEGVEALLPKLRFFLHEGFGPLSEKALLQGRALLRKLKKLLWLKASYGADFATILPPDGGMKLYPVDPREKTEIALAPWKAAILFSATLSPEEYYFELLAGREEDRFLTLSSPFPRENLFVGTVPVDVGFSARFDTAPKICSIIHHTVSQREGNYMVFLPSFEYLLLVSQEYKRRYMQERILVQESGMSPKARRDFLSAFRENKKGSLIGFCVMGGIFAEGVDLKGEALVGEIIVGTGFPPPSAEAEAESAAYYKREMDGKSFAYTLPGWSRVLQAAGRVIRSEEDRGVLILCDMRYTGEDVKELFPDAWDDAVLIERDADLVRHLQQFWK